MLFKQTHYEGIRDGTITVTFRRWSRLQAKVGGLYRLDARGAVRVLAIDSVTLNEIKAGDAPRAGYASVAALVADLERHGGELRPKENVYRIAFTLEAALDPRAVLADENAILPEEIATLTGKLRRMDCRSKDGAWTMATLELVQRQPGVRAGDLAETLGRERLPFKGDVRKLKALGLTISLEVGYKLSPRGIALLAAMRDQAAE